MQIIQEKIYYKFSWSVSLWGKPIAGKAFMNIWNNETWSKGALGYSPALAGRWTGGFHTRQDRCKLHLFKQFNSICFCHVLTLLQLLLWRSSGCWWAGSQWQWLCWGSEGSCCASPASRAPLLHSHLPCTNLQPQHMALALLVTAFHCHNWLSFKDLNFVKTVAKLTVFCDALVHDKPAPAHVWSGSSW